MRRLAVFFVAVLTASVLVGVVPSPPPAHAEPASAEVLVTNQYGGAGCIHNQKLVVADPFTGKFLRSYGSPPGFDFGVFNEAKPFDLNKKIVAVWGGSPPELADQQTGLAVYDRVANAWTTKWEFNPAYGIQKGANSPHSVTVLPDGYFAVAHVGTMAGVQGSGFVIVFSPSGTKIQQVPLSSAHGVEYDKPRNAVFAVGGSEVRKYTYSTSSHTLTEDITARDPLPSPGGHDLRRRRMDSKYFVTTNSAEYVYNPDDGSFVGSGVTPTITWHGVKSMDQGFDGEISYSYYDRNPEQFYLSGRSPSTPDFCAAFYKAGRWLFPEGQKVYPEDVPEGEPAPPPTKLGFGFPHNMAAEARAENAKLAYTSVWAVSGDISGVDEALTTANTEGTIPVIHWYYWGAEIYQRCVDNYSGTPHVDCKNKTRQKWDQGAQALADLVTSMRGSQPTIITLELEFHNNDSHTYEPLDGYLATQAGILGGPAGILVALGWGEWADQDGALNVFDRAQAASDYAGTQVLWSCREPKPNTLAKYRNATGRVIQNANTLKTKFAKPVFVYDYGLSTFSEALSGDPVYSPTNPAHQCSEDGNYEVEQNNQVSLLFQRKQELKDAGVLGVVFRNLGDIHDWPPERDHHKIAERWWGFRHQSVKKLGYATVMNGIRAENGGSNPQPTGCEPADDWCQQAEAFSNRAVGGLCTDAAASGGQCWNVWSNGSISTTTSSIAAGTKQVTVVAKGDPAAGVWPNMVVKVDGTPVMDLAVSQNTWGPFSAAVTLAAGTHVIEVGFTNDGNVNGDDRNLLVDVADIDPATQSWRQEAEAFPIKSTGGTCTTASGSGGLCWNLWSNGHIETTMSAPYASQHEIQVVARGSVAGGVWPRMEVLVDGTLVLSQSVETTTWTSYRIRRVLSGGSHTLRIRFTNDDIVGTEDRNLHLDYAALHS